MILVATTVHAPLLSKHALIWSLVAGTAGGLALAILYASLSSGKMRLAAPVAGVLSAAIPAFATMFREGSPGAPRLIGFALAILGVWLISRSDDRAERRVLGMAILAGCGFAAYALAIRQAGPGSAMWIEVHSRVAALFVTAAITIYLRKLGDFCRSANLWGVAVGLVDVSGRRVCPRHSIGATRHRGRTCIASPRSDGTFGNGSPEREANALEGGWSVRRTHRRTPYRQLAHRDTQERCPPRTSGAVRALLCS